MSQEYQQLLKIRTKHDYFTTRICTQLSFTPTQETELLIRNQRLLVKYLPSGIDVFAPELIPFDGPKTLRWLIRAKANSFFKITELPLKPSKAQYWLGNSSNNLSTPADFSEFGGLLGKDGPIAGSIGSLNSMIPPPYFAVLDITVPNTPEKPKSYTLSFKAKKVYWEYLLLNSSMEVDGDWQLMANGTIKPGTLVKLPDTPLVGDRYRMANLIWSRLDSQTEEALYFSTDEQFPLKEKPDFPISLQKDGEDHILDLPAPQAQNHSVQLIRRPNIFSIP